MCIRDRFGTQIEFVPLVLDNGNIRLEVRPRVSEIDSTRSVSAQADDADRANTRNCGDSNPEAILFV